MKHKRHPPEEIIKKLREAATLLAAGQSIEAVCKKLEVSPPTYHRWRQEYGGAKEETVKQLKELEKENGRLKRLVADLSLDKAILKEIAEGAERSETACRRQPAGQRRRALAIW
jgi:transposase-like protein